MRISRIGSENSHTRLEHAVRIESITTAIGTQASFVGNDDHLRVILAALGTGA
ncbi:hypothetical protein [Mycobacteroides chelonae]|uniref:hypothetical protein n=1 Tax=Mycobacteroides chelonae TaxID=1774 RepID=UPI0012FF93E7|nr:hypothetical protein [Mycobacteroides chelonae]